MFVSRLAIDHDLPITLAAVIGVAAGGVISMLVDLLVLGPIQQRAGTEDQLSIVVATIGSLFAAQQLAGTIFERRSVRVPPLTTGDNFTFRGAVLTRQWILTVVLTVVVFVVIAIAVRYSRTGRYMRALGANPNGARIAGIRERRLRLVAFGVAGGIASLAGLMLGARAGVRFDNGFDWAILGFLSCIVGGTARVIGPLVGGLVVACLQSYASFRIGPAWVDYATLAVAFVFFAFRPEGLFASKVRL
jgi:branched-chain amino acid transport system permease protein